MPVLPAVASTTSPPGLISPRFSASRMIWRAGRSFTDWPGFMNSALPKMMHCVAAEARLSTIKGVLPMASTIPSLACILWGHPRSAAHPPRPAQHGDEPVVGMEVRPAEMVALEPLVEHDVKPGLRRVAHEHRVLRAGGAWRIPFDLVGKFVGERRGIELGRSAGHRQAQRKCRSGEQQAAQPHVSGHSLSLLRQPPRAEKHSPRWSG